MFKVERKGVNGNYQCLHKGLNKEKAQETYRKQVELSAVGTFKLSEDDITLKEEKVSLFGRDNYESTN